MNYSKIAKSFRYKKKATTIFAEVKQLVQRLQLALTEQKIIWKSITLVIALDFLHNDFKMTTALLLHSGDKNLEEIQQRVTSTEITNLAKQTVGVKGDLIIMTKKK